MRNKTTFFLISIFIIAFFLRSWKTGELPTFISDEASIGYNAFSILKTGKDEWGKFLPLVFKSFGEYKLPFYIYLTVPSIAILGLNEFAVRFPSILFGSLTVVAVYYIGCELRSTLRPRCRPDEVGVAQPRKTETPKFRGRRHFLIKELYSKIFHLRGGGIRSPAGERRDTSKVYYYLPLVASFFLAISPWHIQTSRMALEANLSLFLIVLGVYFFLKGISKSKFFYWSFLFFGLSFYTYNAARLFTPLLMMALLVIFRKDCKKDRKQIFLAIVLVLLLITPIFLSGFKGTGERVAKVGIFSDPGLLSSINEKRNNCQASYAKSFCRYLYNRPVYYSYVFAKNYLSHFSYRFLFSRGAGLAQYGVPNRGVAYLFQLPLIIIGLFFLYRPKKTFLILLSWLVLSPIANSFTGPAHPVRAIFLSPVLAIFSAGGVVFLLEGLKKSYKSLALIFLFLIAGYSLLSFSKEYFFNYPKTYTSSWQSGYKILFPKLAVLENKYSKIYVTKYYGEPHIFYLFYRQYNPVGYQQGEKVVRYDRSDRWVNVDQIGNYHFVQEVDPNLIEKGSLLAVSPTEIFTGVNIVDEIKYKDGHTAFLVAEFK